MPIRLNHELLARARTENGLSQEETARLVGVDPRTYRRYESGEVNEGGVFTIRTANRRRIVAALCSELGISEEELVCEALVGVTPAKRMLAEDAVVQEGLLEPSEGARAFVSYSGDSDEHRSAVEAFARWVASCGLQVAIDATMPYPAQGWAQWSISALAGADVILAVCTPMYRGRLERREVPGPGRGATWEGLLLGDPTAALHGFGRIAAVLLVGASPDCIPAGLSSAPRYFMPQDAAKLRAWLTQPIGPRGALDEANDIEAVLADDDLSVYAPGEERALAEYLRDLEAFKNFDPGENDSRLRIPLEEAIHAVQRQLRPASPLSPGQGLGGDTYRLGRLLGLGGFGVVWMAHDQKAKRMVAIKVLKPEHVGDRTRRSRFLRGARVMASLRHPNVVEVFDTGRVEGGHLYFVMEYVNGGDLQSWLRGAFRPGLPAILKVIHSVAEALLAAHRRGIIHRDVKPANILIDAAGHPKLTDFDLVHAPPDTEGWTQPEPMGTYLYSAPEVLSDPSAAAPRGDIYSLGMTLLWCLAGGALSNASERDLARTLEGIDVPIELKALVARASAADPLARHETMQEFLTELEAVESTLASLALGRRRPAEDIPACPTLRSLGAADRHFLLIGGRTKVGRAPWNDLRIEARSVSAQHAIVCWLGQFWMVHDLGSRNGTFVDQRRIGPGENARLREGSVVAFGNKQEAWEIVGARPPPDIAAVAEATGSVVLPTGGILVLSSPDGHAMVYCGSDGWVCDLEDETRPVVDNEVIAIGATRWLLRINAHVDAATTNAELSEFSIHDLELVFRLSGDEEYIHLTAKTPDKTFDCGARAHNYLLLELARWRLRALDVGLPDAAAGWTTIKDLSSIESVPQTNIGVFRLRRQFTALGMRDAPRIIERRSSQLRIGTSRISIVVA